MIHNKAAKAASENFDLLGTRWRYCVLSSTGRANRTGAGVNARARDGACAAACALTSDEAFLGEVEDRVGDDARGAPLVAAAGEHHDGHAALDALAEDHLVALNDACRRDV